MCVTERITALFTNIDMLGLTLSGIPLEHKVYDNFSQLKSFAMFGQSDVHIDDKSLMIKYIFWGLIKYIF